MSFFNPYRILGTHAQQSNEEIRAAYRALARQHHPDRGGDAATFATITAAYAEVSDQPRREALRRKLLVLGTTCGQCSGEGAQRVQRGFTGVGFVRCPACDGAGYTYP